MSALGAEERSNPTTYVRSPSARRVAVLWQAMSGYFNACLKALSSMDGVEIALAYGSTSQSAPFDADQFAWIQPSYQWSGEPSRDGVSRLLESFKPEAVLVSSWHLPAYRAALKDLGGLNVTRVLCMDNQWRGTPKQWLGRLTWRQHIRPYYELVFVPGDRQVRFARMLGFSREHIMRGLYSADTPAFRPDPVLEGDRRPLRFLYVGRLATGKGISVLARAYSLYRAAVPEPWPLDVVGTGPEERLLLGIDGVQLHGFVQPENLPMMMAQATALVCPSLFEPWGVVIHEATAAGVIVLCSEATGAGVHLVQDGYNGFSLRTGSSSDLSRGLVAVTNMSTARHMEMSAASESMSRQFSPERWATYVLDMLAWSGHWDAQRNSASDKV